MIKTKLAEVRANNLPPALAIHVTKSLHRSGALVCEDADDLKELRATIATLTETVQALKAKAATDSTAATELKAKETELKHAQLQEQNAALKAKNTEQEKAITARNKADAEAAVKRAVERHAIAAKDQKTQDALVASATNDPGFCSIIDAMQGNPSLGSRITSPGVTITAEAPNATMKAYAALVCANAKIPLSHETHKEKGRLAREAAALFAKDIEKDAVISSMSMGDAIKAADNSDAAVGLLSGTLVLQRALPLLMFEYPMLRAITSDFSDAPGLLNQTETTRIILKPAVQTYNPDLDTAGRPKGWDTASPAQSVDVSVKLDEHVGVPIVFGQERLAQTVRNLFAEAAPMAMYALGGYAVNKVTALMTAANFNSYKGTSLAAGVTHNGTTAVECTSTANAYVGAAISGTGIPANTYVAQVVDGTHLVLTQESTADGAWLTFTLSDSKVPVTYSTYVKPLADINNASLRDIRVAFSNNELPTQDRFLLLNASYHARLAQDPTLNGFFAAMRNPEIITEGRLPKIQGFDPQEAPWFPSTSNRVGFAGHKSSLILKTRLPNDFTSAVGAAAPGSVTTVTVPGGISVLLVQRVDLTGNYGEWRPEVYLGAAVGQPRSGLVITSA